jgi:TRAP-type C4-dicarboxylate transport system permease small subunit
LSGRRRVRAIRFALKDEEVCALRKLLLTADKGIDVVFRHLGGVFIISTFIIVLIQVLYRYVLHMNTGGVDELSVYFVTCSVWTGAVVCTKTFSEGQIKIDLLRLIFKGGAVVQIVDVLWAFLGAAVMIFFTRLSWRYLMYSISSNSTLSGIAVPMSVFIGVMTLASALIAVYEFAHGVYIIKDKFMKKTAAESHEAGDKEA